jgi:hypothetical protein
LFCSQSTDGARGGISSSGIEVWDDADRYVEELIAEVGQVVVARWARRMVLRHGARVLMRSGGAHN